MSRLHGLLLACLLLWAQLAGAVHALEHLHEDAGEPPACEWCLAFANVQHGASSTTAVPLPALVCERPAASSAPTALFAFAPVYRSRAPPRLPV